MITDTTEAPAASPPPEIRQAVEQMLEGQRHAALAAGAVGSQIAEAISAAIPRLNEGGRIMLIGAGTSGRIAIQDGVELAPTYGWPMDRLVLLLAGGTEALVKSAEAAEDDASLAVEEVTQHAVVPHDVVIGVAASGRTPYTCAAIELARAQGALTIGIANLPDTPLLHLAQIGLCAQTGEEFISGSTRMKAGTAQKIILNTLSTGIMIGLGRTHDGLMSHMSVSNEKLRRRAVDIISRIAGTTLECSEDKLRAAGNDLPVAILMAAGCEPDEARRLLGEAGDSVTKAMAAARRSSGEMCDGA